MTSPAQLQMLHTPDGAYPLHEYHLRLAGREWTVLHTGVVLTFEDERRFFQDLMNHIPYGVALWPSAIALAYELASRGEALAGKTVLELGAGTGLPGIVAASLGAQVVQTDRQEMAMLVCERNGRLNRVAGIERRLVDWVEWQDTQRYDWIIGSDILYGETMHPHLQQIFAANLAPGGHLLLADPFRGASLRLLETLLIQGWDIEITRWALGSGEDDNERAVGLFDLTRAEPI
jgi:predicted nicotinamide N-methyase